jgi:luciferase family oxidoreductase group 1
MTSLSFLDLVPILEGGTLAQALDHAADIAVHCEATGYRRYWVAEHHGMPGIGGAATSVVLAHAGAATSAIRIGAGGIMLPNHAPLQIAEQFGTLDALYPGRVDLGLGRAPGSEMKVARALRRTLHSDPNGFPRDVLELKAYFDADPELGIEAVPGAGAQVEMWILGSSTFGAQLAAALGMPFGFASHFAPAMLDEAIAIYRERFTPSDPLAKPHVMVGYNVFAADGMEEAQFLASTMQQAFLALRTGTPGRVKPPVEGFYESLSDIDRSVLAQTMSMASIGTVETVEADLRRLIARTGADEIIVTSQIYDHDKRKRSIAIAAEAFAKLNEAT